MAQGTWREDPKENAELQKKLREQNNTDLGNLGNISHEEHQSLLGMEPEKQMSGLKPTWQDQQWYEQQKEQDRGRQFANQSGPITEWAKAGVDFIHGVVDDNKDSQVGQFVGSQFQGLGHADYMAKKQAYDMHGETGVQALTGLEAADTVLSLGGSAALRNAPKLVRETVEAGAKDLKNLGVGQATLQTARELGDSISLPGPQMELANAWVNGETLRINAQNVDIGLTGNVYQSRSSEINRRGSELLGQIQAESRPPTTGPKPEFNQGRGRMRGTSARDRHDQMLEQGYDFTGNPDIARKYLDLDVGMTPDPSVKQWTDQDAYMAEVKKYLANGGVTKDIQSEVGALVGTFDGVPDYKVAQSRGKLTLRRKGEASNTELNRLLNSEMESLEQDFFDVDIAKIIDPKTGKVVKTQDHHGGPLEILSIFAEGADANDAATLAEHAKKNLYQYSNRAGNNNRLPDKEVHKPLHAWLRSDAIGLEQTADKTNILPDLKRVYGPNPTLEQRMDAMDVWFEHVQGAYDEKTFELMMEFLHGKNWNKK